MYQDKFTRQLNEIIAENGGEVPEGNDHEGGTKMTKVTKVSWHPYPQTLPTEDGDYLVTYKHFHANPEHVFSWDPGPDYLETFTLEVKSLEFERGWADSKGEFYFEDYTPASSQIWMEIIAWAELPEPYKPEDEQ